MLVNNERVWLCMLHFPFLLISYYSLQTDHEAQRRHNVELVGMQEQSSLRKEQARQVTEEQIQAQQRQTEKERAEIERETIRVKAMAEAEGRAHEAKLTEDHNRRMLMERISGEKEKWLAAINTTFSHIEGRICFNREACDVFMSLYWSAGFIMLIRLLCPNLEDVRGSIC